MLTRNTFLYIAPSIVSRRKKSFIYRSPFSVVSLRGVRISKESLAIAKSIAQCRARVGVVEEAAEKEPREAKFEGVMWHGGYDQSITSSAARAPHTAPILPGPLPFVRYTSAAAEKIERRRDDEGERRGGRVMHAYKFACRL